MMKSLLLVLGLVYLAAAQSTGICRLVGTNSTFSGVTGTITFTQTADGLVTVNTLVAGLTGFSSDALGIHVHTFGDIRPSTTPGSNAGPHWNPTGATHGCDPNPNREYGDMGNWTIDTDGTITQTKVLDLLTLTGGLSIIGRAVVVHQYRDDCSAPIGLSGPRIAYCVVGVANPGAAPAVNQAYISNSTTYGTCTVSPVVSGTNYGGLVTFVQTANGVEIKANVTGFTGVHGIHIHAYGDLLNADQIGGHYDPTATGVHALPTFLPDNAHHLGDIGNLCDQDSSNNTYYKATFRLPSLTTSSSILGRAIAIHAQPDNNVTFGARVAYCVIGVANADNLATTFASATIPTLSSPLCGYAVPTAAPSVAPTVAPVAPTVAPATTSGADLATISIFIAITTLLAMLF